MTEVDKIIVFVGPTCSGKSTLADMVCEGRGISRLITYTTRPARPGERSGIDYHFVDKEHFLKLVRNGSMILVRRYNTDISQDELLYGVLKRDLYVAKNLDSKTLVLILDPDGLEELKREGPHISNKLQVYYLTYPIREAMTRMSNRGDVILDSARVSSDIQVFSKAYYNFFGGKNDQH